MQLITKIQGEHQAVVTHQEGQQVEQLEALLTHQDLELGLQLEGVLQLIALQIQVL